MSKLKLIPTKYLFIGFGVLLCLGCTPSFGGKKHDFVNKSDSSQMRKAHQKSTSIISVEALGDDQFKVDGSITAHEELLNGESLWSIPDGTQLVSGYFSEELSLAAGETKHVQIVISGLRDGGKIVLLPHKVIQKERHGTPTLYVHGQKSQASKSSVQQKTLSSKKKRIFQ